MTVRTIVPKSQKSLQPTQTVADINDKFVQMAIQDLKETLKNQQLELDKQNPGKGGGVGKDIVTYLEAIKLEKI